MKRAMSQEDLAEFAEWAKECDCGCGVGCKVSIFPTWVIETCTKNFEKYGWRDESAAYVEGDPAFEAMTDDGLTQTGQQYCAPYELTRPFMVQSGSYEPDDPPADPVYSSAFHVTDFSADACDCDDTVYHGPFESPAHLSGLASANAGRSLKLYDGAGLFTAYGAASWHNFTLKVKFCWECANVSPRAYVFRVFEVLQRGEGEDAEYEQVQWTINIPAGATQGQCFESSLTTYDPEPFGEVEYAAGSGYHEESQVAPVLKFAAPFTESELEEMGMRQGVYLSPCEQGWPNCEVECPEGCTWNEEWQVCLDEYGMWCS